MDADRTEDVQAVFERIHRPLRWPLADYRRRKISGKGFTGFVFSRGKGDASAGFAYGFALEPDALPGIREPPEVAVHVFVKPVGSDLHRELVTRPRSPVRRLVADSRSLPHPFEFHPEGEVVAVRHRPVGRLPRELFVLGSADFFMTTQGPLQTRGFVRRVTEATERRGR